MSKHDADVIVVGAGFSGLSAALALRAKGLDVIVLEARNRVGGRVEAVTSVDGDRFDAGGQFVCDDMPEIMALVRRHGRTLLPAPVDGRFLMQPPLSEREADGVFAGSSAIRERVKGTDPGDPAIAGLTVAAWLHQEADPPAAKHAFQSLVEGLWCRPIAEIPLWYLIDNDRRITNAVTELQYFLGDTLHGLAEELAAGLADRLVLDAPVTRIARLSQGVEIDSAKGRFTARQVIVAVPPVMASRIIHEPPLPSALAQAFSAWRSGTVIKIRIRYARRFWRDAGLSGMVMWRDLHGLFVCDVSPSDDAAALVVFIGGPLAVDWSHSGKHRLRDMVMQRLVPALGELAADPLDFAVRDWINDPWSGGGYSDVVTDMEATDAEAVIRAGEPPLHFASSELSPSFPGYVEGAIIAGRRAAVGVIAELANQLQSAKATSASGS